MEVLQVNGTWKYISYSLFIAVLPLYFVRYIDSYLKSFPGNDNIKIFYKLFKLYDFLSCNSFPLQFLKQYVRVQGLYETAVKTNSRYNQN